MIYLNTIQCGIPIACHLWKKNVIIFFFYKCTFHLQQRIHIQKIEQLNNQNFQQTMHIVCVCQSCLVDVYLCIYRWKTNQQFTILILTIPWPNVYGLCKLCCLLFFLENNHIFTVEQIQENREQYNTYQLVEEN